MYVVIMAGGGGTRLWPLSRRALPKPFLPLLGSETLFERAVARAAGLDGGSGRPVGHEGVFVVAEAGHVPLAVAQAPGLDPRHVLGEPIGRNTAAAIALATLAIERPDDEIMVVLPSDQWIGDEDGFRDVLRRVTASGGLAAGGAFGIPDPLATLGIRPDPDRPETGFGYLLPQLEAGATIAGIRSYPLAGFEEKPPLERATELVRTPGVAWNAGMFVWRRGVIRDALARFAPDILDGVRAALAASGDGGPLDGSSSADAYRAVRATSIDYAVMEEAARAGTVVMAAMDVGWSDIGNWRAVRDALGGNAAGMVAVGRVEDIESERVLVESAGGRLVVTIGLRDTIVIDTPDAVLVCAADRAQDVRQIVERLTAAQEAEHL